MTLSSLLFRAIEVASVAHENQKKKDTDIPFIAHIFGVGMMLLHSGADEEVVIAGLLHDSVEKAEISLHDITRDFGKRVADIVSACTETGDEMSWKERKKSLLSVLRTAPPEVKKVMCADKMHNLLFMKKLYDGFGDAVWSRYSGGKEGQKWYYSNLAEVFRAEVQREIEFSLYRQFVDLVDDFIRKL